MKTLKYQEALLIPTHRQSPEVRKRAYNDACSCAGDGEILNPEDFAPHKFTFDRVHGLAFRDGRVVVYSISGEGEVDAEFIGFKILRRSKKGSR